MEDPIGLKQRILDVTEGRGADVVMEVVGLSPALRMGFDILRPWGTISSVGVHNAEVSLHSYSSLESAFFMFCFLCFCVYFGIFIS